MCRDVTNFEIIYFKLHTLSLSLSMYIYILEYYGRSSALFRCKCTFFSEHNVPGLKTIANDKLLFARLYTL